MSRLTTPLCRILGITVPIVQAPISASPKFVAAVSNAGGLGMIQATWHKPDELVKTIAKVRALTDKPFGVNFVLSLIEDQNFANMDAALDEGVSIISTFWGDPAPVIDRIHTAGALSLHTVGSADEARQVANLGVDVLVAQGVEAGGHVWGQVGSMVLTPAVVDAVPNIPVIAAGGIADGRGLAAALALGAEAVWVGTRLLLAEEYDGHMDSRLIIKDAKETDTILTSLFDVGWPDAPHRCLVNDTVNTWTEAGCPDTGMRPNEGEVIAYAGNGDPIERYSMEGPSKHMTGQISSLCMYAGQGVALTNSVKPAGDIVNEMVDEAAKILANLAAS